MSKLETAEQFEKGLSLSTQCAKRKWQHSTDMTIASIVAKSNNKDKTITMLTKIVNETETEQEALEKIKAL